MLSNESGIIGRSSCGWSACSFWMCSFASKTPSEVRALTAAPSSPAALASASALCSLFTGLKEPYLRTTLGMFQSSLNIPFLNNPMFWRTLLTTVLPLMLLGRMSLGKDEQPSSAPFFSIRASETKSFTKVENGVLVSHNKGTGVSQVMKKSCQAQIH